MIEDLTQSFEDAELKKSDVEAEGEGKPDPLTQLVTTFCRGAMTERSGALQEDPLYMSYAHIIAKSCGEEEEEGGEEEEEGAGEAEGEEEGGASIHVSWSPVVKGWDLLVIISSTSSVSLSKRFWTTKSVHVCMEDHRCLCLVCLVTIEQKTTSLANQVLQLI